MLTVQFLCCNFIKIAFYVRWQIVKASKSSHAPFVKRLTQNKSQKCRAELAKSSMGLGATTAVDNGTFNYFLHKFALISFFGARSSPGWSVRARHGPSLVSRLAARLLCWPAACFACSQIFPLFYPVMCL